MFVHQITLANDFEATPVTSTDSQDPVYRKPEYGIPEYGIEWNLKMKIGNKNGNWKQKWE